MISWLSSLFSKVTPAQKMVQVRNEVLADNTDKVDKVALVKESLWKCFNEVKEANPALFKTFPPGKILSEKEMAEQLEIVMLATMTDLQGLHQDLQEAREKRALLEQLLIIWEKIEKIFDNALENGEQAQALDRKNVKNLTDLRGQVQKAGQTPTCRNGSML